MKKIIKVTDFVFFILSFLFFTIIFTSEFLFPDNVIFYDGQETVKIMSVFTAEKTVSDRQELQSESAKISLFGIMPVATVSAKATDRKYVYVGGELIGIRLYTDGILVVGLETVNTSAGDVSPGKDAGIEKGDIITEVNGKVIKSVSQFSSMIYSSEGKTLKVKVNRNDKYINVVLNPVLSVSEKKYRCGLWLRDSTAGIGTMTFADPEEKIIASLGHAICDSETGAMLPVGDGDILSAVFNGCIAGTKGITGQIKGSFGTATLGKLCENNDYGVYATYTDIEFDEENLYPVASQTEIETGPAQIISTVTADGSEFYDIEIEKITYSREKAVRSMVIKVTDDDLIDAAGGIIQGMSGSPIIQNGMFIGAVTHVFLNDPTRGYAIFAETMIETGQSVSDGNLKTAS